MQVSSGAGAKSTPVVLHNTSMQLQLSVRQALSVCMDIKRRALT